MSFDDKVQGGLYGLLVGDACGVPYEFKSKNDIPKLEDIGIIPPTYYKKRSYQQIPVGTWSDDGAQALCLLSALIESPDSFDIQNFANKLTAWLYSGYLAVDNNVFDVGIQTAKALDMVRRGVSIEAAATNDERYNGNGSLMRVLPIALWYTERSMTHKNLVDIFVNAQLQSTPTHPHIRSRLVCGIYALMASFLLQGQSICGSLELALRAADEFVTNAEMRKELQLIVDAENNEITGSGYVVDSFWSAVYAARTTSTYKEAIQTAISFGNDTDTTACITGGLVGIYYGYTNLPADWLSVLRGQDLVKPLAQKLSLRHKLKGE